MIGNFFKKKNKDRDFLVLDVGSRHLKAFLLRVFAEGVPEIIDQEIVKNEDGHDISSLAYQVRKRILARNKTKSSGIAFSLSGRNLFGKTDFLSYSRSKPKSKISKKEIIKVVQKAEKEIFESNKKYFSENYEVEEKLELGGSISNNFRIDDKNIQNPIGKVGKNVQLEIFNFFLPREKSLLLDDLTQDFHSKNILAVPSGFSIFQNFETGDENYLIVDIGYTAANIYLILKNSMMEIFSLNIGSSEITAELAKRFDLSFKESEEIVIDKEKQTGKKRELNKIKKSYCSILASNVEIVLEEILKRRNLDKPKTLPVFFVGGASENEIIGADLKNHFSIEGFVSTVEILKPENLSGLNFDKEKIFSPIETSAVATCLFLANFLNHGESF